jgi:hypothetical protein
MRRRAARRLCGGAASAARREASGQAAVPSCALTAILMIAKTFIEKRSKPFAIMENLANMPTSAIFARPGSRGRQIARVPVTGLLIICPCFHSTRYRG